MATKVPKLVDTVSGDTELALASSDELNVGLVVRHAFRAFTRVLQVVTAPHGLTAAEFRVLRALSSGDPLTQIGIAARAGMDRPYATLVAKRLREKGLVESAVDPSDKRRVAMSLTPRGASISNGIAAQLARANRVAVHGVKSNDLTAFMAVCSRIASNLATLEP